MPITSHKKNIIVFILTSVICTCLYLFTRSTQLTWANYGNDSGDFLAALLTTGIPHPTGYPTYMMLGFLLQRVPFGDFYFRAILLSLLPAALSAGVMSLVAKKYLFREGILINYGFSLFTGLVWGLAPFLWSQALIVEVQGLQSLFITCAIWWCLYLFQPSPQVFSIWKVGFFAVVFGLGLGNHLTLLFFLPVIMLGNLFAYKQGMPIKMIVFQVIGTAIALLVYLYIPLRARTYPAINWGNAANWEGFWWLISGQAYHHLVFELTLAQFLNRLSALAAILRSQVGVVGIILAVLGIVQNQLSNRYVRFMLFYIFFIYALFAIFYGTDDSIVYLLPSFAVLTIWIGLSLPILMDVRFHGIAFGKWAILVCLILFIAAVPTNWQKVYSPDDTQAAEFAEMAINNVPENAILLTHSDPDSFPLWYYHFGLKQRQDLTIIVLPLSQYRWYQEILNHIYPQIKFPSLIKNFSNNSQSWGEQTANLNSDHIICRSELIRLKDLSIEISCTNQQVFTFPIQNK